MDAVRGARSSSRASSSRAEMDRVDWKEGMGVVDVEDETVVVGGDDIEHRDLVTS